MKLIHLSEAGPRISLSLALITARPCVSTNEIPGISQTIVLQPSRRVRAVVNLSGSEDFKSSPVLARVWGIYYFRVRVVVLALWRAARIIYMRLDG